MDKTGAASGKCQYFIQVTRIAAACVAPDTSSTKAQVRTLATRTELEF